MKEFYPYLLESLLETLNNHQIELVDDWKTENQDLSGTLPENTHDKTFAKFNKGKKKSSRILIPFNAPNNINKSSEGNGNIYTKKKRFWKKKNT